MLERYESGNSKVGEEVDCGPGAAPGRKRGIKDYLDGYESSNSKVGGGPGGSSGRRCCTVERYRGGPEKDRRGGEQ